MISASKIRQLIDYNPTTGSLVWIERSRKWFDRDQDWKRWNNRFAGHPALAAKTDTGYMHGCVLYERVRAHRVAWVIHHGKWPKGEIDHINGDKVDNRILNLRCVTHLENSQNAGICRRNSSGVTGVCWNKRTQKWSAAIRSNGIKIYLGEYTDLREASAVRKFAEVKCGFHKNHGTRKSYFNQNDI